MKKTEVVDKLETLVKSMREELAKNDGSTLQTIASSVKGGYDSVKCALDRNLKARKILENMKQSIDDLSQAVKKGDSKLSAKTLDALEKRIREFKEKAVKEEDMEHKED